MTRSACLTFQPVVLLLCRQNSSLWLGFCFRLWVRSRSLQGRAAVSCEDLAHPEPRGGLDNLGGWAQPVLDNLHALRRKTPASELAREAHPLGLAVPPQLEPKPVAPWSCGLSLGGGTYWPPCFFSSASAEDIPENTADSGEVWEKSPWLCGGRVGAEPLLMRNFGDSVDWSRHSWRGVERVCANISSLHKEECKRRLPVVHPGLLDKCARTCESAARKTRPVRGRAGQGLGSLQPWGPSSPLLRDALSPVPGAALSGSAASGFHQTSKSSFYYYYYCYYYQLYIFSDYRSNWGLL